MNAIESQAAQALLNIATHEHKYLTQSAAHDGFELSPISTCIVTDELFDAWFSLKLGGRTVHFRFTLGYDECDTGRALYQPKVEVTASPDDGPSHYDYSYAAGAPVGEHDLLDAVLMFSREAGEARVQVFRWLEHEAESAADSTHPINKH